VRKLMRSREEDCVEFERLRGIDRERFDLQRSDRQRLEARKEIGRSGSAFFGLPGRTEETDDLGARVCGEDREEFGAGVAARADDGAAERMSGGVLDFQRRLHSNGDPMRSGFRCGACSRDGAFCAAGFVVRKVA